MTKAIREVYGEALAEYGRENQRVVVLDADVSGSTRSALFGAEFPERFFNMGIAEANMVSVSAGLASVGLIPFVNTFAVFLTSIGLAGARLLGSYARLPIKLAGAYGGLSDAFDGPSHHSLEDLAVMRSLPGFQVFVPSDARETKWLVQYAIDTEVPVYIRLSRDSFPDLYSDKEAFVCGKGKTVREGKDATVIACGLMVGNALKAAEILEREGISVRIVDMFCIKPLDQELILTSARETGAIVSAEEHNVIGGLGSAIAEVLCAAGKQVPMELVGMKDCHAECGPYEALQKKYGLDPEAVAEAVRRAVRRKCR